MDVDVAIPDGGGGEAVAIELGPGEDFRPVIGGPDHIERAVVHGNVELAIGVQRGGVNLVGSQPYAPEQFSGISIHTTQLTREYCVVDSVAHQNRRTGERSQVVVSPRFRAAIENQRAGITRGRLRAQVQ